MTEGAEARREQAGDAAQIIVRAAEMVLTDQPFDGELRLIVLASVDEQTAVVSTANAQPALVPEALMRAAIACARVHGVPFPWIRVGEG